MSDVELFCFEGVLIQNVNIVDLLKKIEKKLKTSSLGSSVSIEMTLCKTMRGGK
jgi:hypothetical protein